MLSLSKHDAQHTTAAETMFVYILECSNRSYYVGVTNDVARRVAQHNEGLDQKSYTHNKRPVSLKFCEGFDDPLQAIEFEKRLKGWSRKKKEALFKGDWEEVRNLAKNFTQVIIRDSPPFDRLRVTINQSC